MIIHTLTTSDIASQLRSDEYANWTQDAAWVLAEYLINLSEDMGQDIELDPVAVRCEFSEYDPEGLVECYSQYLEDDDILEENGWLTPDGLTPEGMEVFLESLRENTSCLILLDNGNILLADF